MYPVPTALPRGTLQVYSCAPKGNPNYTFRESIPLGVTSISQQQVRESGDGLRGPVARRLNRSARTQFRRSIEGLQDEWQGWTYDLLSRNCNHFCESLVEILGVGPLPGATAAAHATSSWLQARGVEAFYSRVVTAHP